MTKRSRLKYLRLQPFHQNTEEGRAAERYRRAAWTIAASVAAKAVSLAVLIVSVNSTVTYLGPERFGAWMTIASLAGMLTFLDLGVGNALTNRVAEAANSDDDRRLESTISGGLGVLLAISATMAILLTTSANLLPWERIVKVNSSGVVIEIERGAIAFGFMFALTTFSTGVNRVHLGLQRGFTAHLATAVGSLVSLVAVYLAATLRAEIPWLLLCTMIGPVLANLALLVRLAKRRQFSFRGAYQATFSEAPGLMRQGALYFSLQVGIMIGWGADSLIIANTAGASSVADYAVIQRLIQFVSQPLAILNGPLWPAYADAHSRGEKEFVRRTFKRSFIFTISTSSIGAILLILLGGELASIWTDGKVRPEYMLVTMMAIWMIFQDTGNSLAQLLNGIGVVKEQVYVVCTFIVLALPLKLWFANEYGATGVVTAGIIAYLLSTAFGYGVVFRSAISNRIK